MVCVGLSERDLKIFGGPLGEPGKILGGKCPPATPLAPPLELGYRHYTIDRLGVMAQKAVKMLLKIMNE